MRIFTYKPYEAYFLLLTTGMTANNELLTPSDSATSIYATKLAQYEEYFDATTCGYDKQCVLPSECYGGCNGMGFSYQGNDYVIECSALPNQKYSLKFSYNDATPKNVRIAGEETIRSNYFLNGMVGSNDAQLYCTAVVNVSGWSGSDE
ncbi:hypothetical protein COOONC_17373, partial [Cooperia oncophora]